GSGIFMNPYVVARQVHTPFLILGAWVVGGLIALAGAFIYAELAALRPEVGGQYAYLRDAFHPAAAFVYGWGLLLVTQSGGMAAALVPVLCAYGGWQTSSFVAAELRRPERDLPRGLLLGVIGVIVLYLAVNAVCVRALGSGGLAGTTTPASTMMRLALGDRG